MVVEGVAEAAPNKKRQGHRPQQVKVAQVVVQVAVVPQQYQVRTINPEIRRIDAPPVQIGILIK